MNLYLDWIARRKKIMSSGLEGSLHWKVYTSSVAPAARHALMMPSPPGPGRWGTDCRVSLKGPPKESPGTVTDDLDHPKFCLGDQTPSSSAHTTTHHSSYHLATEPSCQALHSHIYLPYLIVYTRFRVPFTTHTYFYFIHLNTIRQTRHSRNYQSCFGTTDILQISFHQSIPILFPPPWSTFCIYQ